MNHLVYDLECDIIRNGNMNHVDGYKMTRDIREMDTRKDG